MKLGTMLAAAGLVLAASVGAASAQVITIGTSQPGTVQNSAGAALAKVLKEKRDIEARVQPFAGSGPLLALVQQQRLDVAIVNVFEMANAVDGVAPFEGKHPDLRVASSIFQLYVGFIVPKNSPMQTIGDIKGKNIPAGYSAAPIIEVMRKAIMANAGVTDDQVTLVPVPNSVRGGDLMQAGRVDLAFLSMGSAKVAELDAAMGGLRYLPLNRDEKSVAALRAIMPQGSAIPVAAAPNRPGVTNGVPLLGYDMVLVVHKDASARLIQGLIDILSKETAALAESLPAFRDLTAEQMAGVPNTEYHAAAVAQFKAMGVKK